MPNPNLAAWRKASLEKQSALKKQKMIHMQDVRMSMLLLPLPLSPVEPTESPVPNPAEGCKTAPRPYKVVERYTYTEFPQNYKWVQKKGACAVRSSAPVVESSAPAVDSRLEQLGCQIFDETVLCGGIERLLEERAAGCPRCGAQKGVQLRSRVKRGVGGGWLLFECANEGCAHTHVIKRSEELQRSAEDMKKGGPSIDASTLRFVLAAKAAGMGLAQANQFLLGCDIPRLNEKVWATHAQKFEAATERTLEEVFSENLKEERRRPSVSRARAAACRVGASSSRS